MIVALSKPIGEYRIGYDMYTGEYKIVGTDNAIVKCFLNLNDAIKFCRKELKIGNGQKKKYH